jgi:hypothetical protein
VNDGVRAVAVHAYAACPFSIAGEYAVEYLKRAETGQAEAEIHVPVRFFPAFVRRRVDVSFSLHIDVLEGGRAHDEIRMRWKSGSPLLPDFSGTLRFRIAGKGTDINLDGTYRVPFGTLGRIFDLALGRHIARVSLGDLALRIARALEENERAWCAHVTAV